MNTDLLETILQLVERFGLSLVLLILGIFWLKPKLDAVWSEYSNQRKNRELTEKQKELQNVDNILIFDLQINGLLNELLLDIDCDWCQLWQFHNGVYNLSLPHIPFLYVSITHEVQSDNVMPMSVVYKSIPTSFFRAAGEKLLKDEMVITNLPEDANEISRTLALGALANVLLPIRNSKGHLTALLSVGYCKTHIFTEADITSIQIKARQLGISLATALVGVGPEGKK